MKHLNSNDGPWGNDDLLLTEKARNAARKSDRDAFNVLDWPELRAAFTEYEDEAKAAKARIRRFGIQGALLAGIGAAAVPLVSMWPGFIGSVLVAIAALSSLVGFALAVVHALSHTLNDRWLKPRMFAERLRHFYFQCLLTHFTIAANAVEHPEKLPEWETLRSKALGDARLALEADLEENWAPVSDDKFFRRIWINVGSPADPVAIEAACLEAVAKHPAGADTLLAKLYWQRLKIQLRYTEKQLSGHWQSPKIRAIGVRLLNLISVVGFPLLIVLGSALALTENPFWGAVAIATGSSLAAIGLTFRVLDQGMRITEDKDRYVAYLADLKKAEDRFTRPGADKFACLQALFDVERYAYWETREFLNAHTDESFGF